MKKNQARLRFQDFSFTKINDQSFVKKLRGEPIFFKLIDWKNQDKFEQILDLQKQVWGFDDISVVPKNILSIATDTGGLIVLVENQAGQALGFALCLGTTDNFLLLHMIGITANLRFSNLGFNLSVFVALIAQEKHIDQIIWTFDPLRGSNANLNFAKLGGRSDTYLIDKYGQISSTLYGQIPTDRLLVKWDISDPVVIRKLLGVERQTVKSSVKKITKLPIVDSQDLDLQKIVNNYQKLLVEIPADIDLLSDLDKTIWRKKLRQILVVLLPPSQSNHIKKGNYQISDFFSIKSEDKKRQNYYLLTRKR